LPEKKKHWTCSQIGGGYSICDEKGPTLLKNDTRFVQLSSAFSIFNDIINTSRNVIGQTFKEMFVIRRINLEKGLENTGGSLDFYKGLVQDFHHNTAHVDKIAGLVSEGNYEAAEIQVHSLKGVSNMLGFEALSHLMSKVENALKEKDPVAFKRLIPPLREEIDHLFDELERSELLQENIEKVSHEEYNEQDKEILIEKLKQLLSMVREGRYQAEVLVSELLSRYGTFGLKKELLEVKAKIEKLDFQDAEALIKTIQNGI